MRGCLGNQPTYWHFYFLFLFITISRILIVGTVLGNSRNIAVIIMVTHFFSLVLSKCGDIDTAYYYSYYFQPFTIFGGGQYLCICIKCGYICGHDIWASWRCLDRDVLYCFLKLHLKCFIPICWTYFSFLLLSSLSLEWIIIY